jgi:hypothetical protein
MNTSSSPSTPQTAPSNGSSPGLIHTSGLSSALNKANLKIPGVSDDATIAAKVPTTSAAQTQTQTVPTSVTNPPVATTPSATAPSVSSTSQKTLVVIDPYSASNATLIGQDASKLRVDPQGIQAAVASFSSALLNNYWWLKRVANTGIITNFDGNGNITSGAYTTGQATFTMGHPGSTSVSLPVIGFLLRVMSYSGQLGQTGQIAFTGSSELTLPTFQFQQDDATKVSYALIPSAVGAMLDTESQAAALAGNNEPYVITGTSAITQVANDKMAMPVSYATTSSIFTLTGTNASVMILPIVLSSQRAKALLEASRKSTLPAYYASLLSEAPQIFANVTAD